MLGVLLGGGAGFGSVYAQGAKEIRLEPGTGIEVTTAYSSNPRALARSDYYDPQFIRQAQYALSDMGYDPGNYDGRIGWRTREAIRNFQRDENLPITGELDPGTVDRLGIR
jgi:hypothetical protein